MWSHFLSPPPFSLCFLLHTLPSPFPWSCTHAGMPLIMWLHAPPSFLPSLPYISCKYNTKITKVHAKSVQQLDPATSPPLNSSQYDTWQMCTIYMPVCNNILFSLQHLHIRETRVCSQCSGVPSFPFLSSPHQPLQRDYQRWTTMIIIPVCQGVLTIENQ